MKFYIICTAWILLVASGASAQDMQFNQYRRSLLNSPPNKKKLAIDTTCTDKEGVVHRIGEKTYDTCMKTAPKPKSAPVEDSLPKVYSEEK